jgi:uncharacterized protein YodC (DUF2158 family)
MQASEVEIGKLVRLAAGGPTMVVVAVDSEIACCWFVEREDVFRQCTFPVEALIVAPA